MKTVDVVIGLGYGDEGKGVTTDYLAKKYAGKNAAVFRFNGGAQAAHTVQLPDGSRNVFNHIGSGLFSGLPTVMTRHVIVNPTLLFKEITAIYENFKINSTQVGIYVDPRARVTTPYDVFVNQELERRRSRSRHGSCGIGINETMQRNQTVITVGDFQNPRVLKTKLLAIRDEYFPARLKHLGIEDADTSILSGADLVFLDDALDFAQYVTIVEDTEVFEQFDHVIFEGAQGLCLDKNSRDFPNVTNSNTGMKNVMEVIGECRCALNVHYITRSYATRHGAGPLRGEVAGLYIEDKTNQPNEFQGNLRFAELDFNRIAEEVQADMAHYWQTMDFKITAVVTCCDQSELINTLPINVIIGKIVESVGAESVLTNWGPCTDSMVETPLESLEDRLPA